MRCVHVPKADAGSCKSTRQAVGLALVDADPAWGAIGISLQPDGEQLLIGSRIGMEPG